MGKVIALALVIMLTGCAFTAHTANVAIDQPSSAPSSVANGATILLEVVDERDETDLGRRGAGIGAAKVKSPEQLMQKFTQVVEEGFRRKGFQLTDDSSAADAELVVALRTLKFEESQGFFTIGAEVDAAIIAEAERENEKYRNQYRSSDEDRQFAISFGSGIDEQVNLVLNNVLKQLLDDRQLDNFLAGS